MFDFSESSGSVEEDAEEEDAASLEAFTVSFLLVVLSFDRVEGMGVQVD